MSAMPDMRAYASAHAVVEIISSLKLVKHAGARPNRGMHVSYTKRTSLHVLPSCKSGYEGDRMPDFFHDAWRTCVNMHAAVG